MYLIRMYIITISMFFLSAIIFLIIIPSMIPTVLERITTAKTAIKTFIKEGEFYDRDKKF